MSEQVPPPMPPRYTGGQIAMVVIGVILLLPGLCSLGFLIVMMPDLLRGNTIAKAIAPLWIICFLVSAGGIALIYLARKAARAGAANSPEPKP
jgi:hypothetical protein